ncbi:YdeI/OmpD-associated family protein [Spirosoma arcticum]
MTNPVRSPAPIISPISSHPLLNPLASPTKTPDTLAPKSASDWREWLSRHHADRQSVWLMIFRKHGQTPSLTHDEALDEALCFGWIDSAIRKGDDEHHRQLFSQRKPKSNWSRVNKEKVAKLTAAGRMTEAGQAMVDLAKKTGTWTALDEVEKGTIPPDLDEAFKANATAKNYFEGFPPSARRGILEWLLNAKTEMTRTKRITEIVAKAAKNERANFPDKKK